MKLFFPSLVVIALAGFVEAAEPARPRITGLSHVALYVHDVEQSRRFYTEFLGYEAPYSLTHSDGSPSLTVIKVNDRQTIELIPEQETNTDRLVRIALQTDDAEAMRLWLASKGVKVPEKIGQNKTGDLNFTVRDPDDHELEFVQYAPESWTARDKGKFMPDTRISERMMHAGILVGDLDTAMKFYGGILGGTATWRGGPSGRPLNWVNVKLPDTDDYVEFMLYATLPNPTARGGQHHICLEVPDIQKSLAILKERAEKCHYTRLLQISTGANRKRQLNVYDPDRTRIELMEPNTVDGLPAPSSTNAPPVHPK